MTGWFIGISQKLRAHAGDAKQDRPGENFVVQEAYEDISSGAARRQFKQV